MSKMDNLKKWLGFASAILPMTLAAAGVPADKIGTVTALAKDAETAIDGEKAGASRLGAVLDGLKNGMAASGASTETIEATSAAVTTGLSAGIQLTNEVHAISNAHHAGDVAVAAAGGVVEGAAAVAGTVAETVAEAGSGAAGV